MLENCKVNFLENKLNSWSDRSNHGFPFVENPKKVWLRIFIHKERVPFFQVSLTNLPFWYGLENLKVIPIIGKLGLFLEVFFSGNFLSRETKEVFTM